MSPVETNRYPIRNGEAILPPAQFEAARAILRRGVDDLLRNAADVHYTQDAAARWAAIADNLRVAGAGPKLRKGDCSSTTSWLLENALTHVHEHTDLVNGEQWRAGYTGTQIDHGRVVRLDSSLRLGDLVFYGDQGGGVPEHVAMALGGGVVFSHGSEAGPFKLALDYRGDRRRGEARRYFTHA